VPVTVPIACRPYQRQKKRREKDKGARSKEPTHERVVAAESDGQLSLARVSVNALGHLLVDLRAVHHFSISTVITLA
jgi:hypothetical protein